MTINSELVRHVECKLEGLPDRGFKTVLHVMAVIAVLKESSPEVCCQRNALSGTAHGASVENVK